MDAYRHVPSGDLCEYYDMLVGPDGFECLLTEPEDRNWYRDGRVVIDRLNAQHAELAALRAEVERLRAELREHCDLAKSSSAEHADVEAAWRAEVQRLRQECEFWRGRLRIASAKMDGQHEWRLSIYAWPLLVGPDADAVVRNALEALRTQPLPAPPNK